MMIPKIRVPFPVRVFVSYFAVVAAGAIPALIYLQVSFYDQIIADRTEEMARKGGLLAEQLRPLSNEARLATIQNQARLEPIRVTYIGQTGTVLFDTVGATVLDNHSQRPEVVQALGTTERVGIARRTSATTKDEVLYVAVRVDSGARSEVIRFAYPMDRIEEITGGMRDAIRNSQAAALTVAILLSLLAAYMYSRPLQRLARTANNLAGGDFTPSDTWTTEDEIGDVGRALNRLALDIRTRLANADSGMILLEQLVEDIDTPVAVLSGTDAIAVNAAFRRVVEHDTRDAEEVLSTILRSVAFTRARTEAESRSDGIAFGFAREKFGIPMRLFALKQASQESLSILHCHVPEGFLTHWHPNAADVTTLNVMESAEDAIRRCQAVYPSIQIEVDSSEGPFRAADVDRRLDTALDFAIDAAADESPEGFTIELRQTDTTIIIVLQLPLPSWIGKLAGSLLSPVGGVVNDDSKSLTFSVPRA